MLPTFQGALDFAASQARRIIATYPGYTPMYTVGGRWNREGERWTHWCEGFYPCHPRRNYGHWEARNWLRKGMVERCRQGLCAGCVLRSPSAGANPSPLDRVRNTLGTPR
jgi:hypothetical protein